MIIFEYFRSLIATATATALTDNEWATVGGVHQSRRLPNAIAEKTAEVAATPSNRSARQAADSETEPKQKPRMTEPNEPTKSRDADSTPTVNPRRATSDERMRCKRAFATTFHQQLLGNWLPALARGVAWSSQPRVERMCVCVWNVEGVGGEWQASFWRQLWRLSRCRLSLLTMRP